MYSTQTKEGKTYVNQNKIREDLMMLAITMNKKDQTKLLKIIKEWSKADTDAREAYNDTQDSVITS